MRKTKLFYRYIAVCAPFFRLRHNIKARYYILPIFFFAPVYNLPRFFEFKTVQNTTFTCVRNISDFTKIQTSLREPSLSGKKGLIFIHV